MNSEDKEKVLLLGAVDYLVKPPQFDMLQSAIARTATIDLCKKDEGYLLVRKAA